MFTTLQLSTGPLALTPLSIYHIPCNETNPILKTGFGYCPKGLTVTVPIFRENTIHYVPWIAPSNGSTMQLHYESMTIPPPLKFNKTTINALDKAYLRLDGKLHYTLRTINKDIDQIKETQETETALIVASVALSLAGLNTIFLIAYCCIVTRYQRKNNHANDQNTVTFHPATDQVNLPSALPQKDTKVDDDHSCDEEKCDECNSPLHSQDNEQ